MTNNKTEHIQVRIEPELKQLAKKLADKEGRSLSNWIIRLIQNAVDNEKEYK